MSAQLCINLELTHLPLFNSSPQPVFLDRGGTIGLCIDTDFADDKEIGLSRGSSSDLLSSGKLLWPARLPRRGSSCKLMLKLNHNNHWELRKKIRFLTNVLLGAGTRGNRPKLPSSKWSRDRWPSPFCSSVTQHRNNASWCRVNARFCVVSHFESDLTVHLTSVQPLLSYVCKPVTMTTGCTLLTNSHIFFFYICYMERGGLKILWLAAELIVFKKISWSYSCTKLTIRLSMSDWNALLFPRKFLSDLDRFLSPSSPSF